LPILIGKIEYGNLRYKWVPVLPSSGSCWANGLLL
jgi:hypothetical protein